MNFGAIRPFLKWAGGKYRLLPRILPELPAGARLVEPFVGSGAVYLNTPCEQALLCDANADLIALYKALQEQGESCLAAWNALFTASNNTPEAYYALRERFNKSRDSEERSALLLYLNRHGFNGLMRYNARGEFNVPFGRYKAPYFPLKELRAFCRKLREVPTRIEHLDFRASFALLRPGDVAYCDPPYVPLSATASFTAYTGSTFGPRDQADLARLAREAGQRGIKVILSNHDTDATRSLYSTARIASFAVRRCISCRGQARGEAAELLAVFA